MEQNTDEWLEFRRSKIGASDAPILMGLSKYKTPYDLWLDKMGFGSNVETEAMRWGKNNEEKVRWLVEEHVGFHLTPTILVSQEYPWMMASIDGWNEERRFAVEIKCPYSPKNYELVKNGEIPKDWYVQVQHQLIVLNIQNVCLAVWRPDERLIFIEIPRDEDFAKGIIAQERNFFDSHMIGLVPPISPVINRKDDEWDHAAHCYLETHWAIKKLQEQNDYYRENLIRLSEGKASEGCGIRLTPVPQKGRVDYTNIPELKHIDLDKYRKNPINTYRIESTN
jgi:putative phage-type endonuclease